MSPMPKTAVWKSYVFRWFFVCFIWIRKNAHKQHKWSERAPTCDFVRVKYPSSKVPRGNKSRFTASAIITISRSRLVWDTHTPTVFNVHKLGHAYTAYTFIIHRRVRAHSLVIFPNKQRDKHINTSSQERPKSHRLWLFLFHVCMVYLPTSSWFF